MLPVASRHQGIADGIPEQESGRHTHSAFDLKELEDYPWFPVLLRNFQTDYIGFLVKRLKVYGAFIRHVRSLGIKPLPMTDLCSGSGEPAVSVYRNCSCFTQLILTDKFPNPHGHLGERIEYSRQPVDVSNMNFQAGTYYTMFNAFHHFNDTTKHQIVQRILSSGSSALIVEPLEPTLVCLCKIFLAGTFGTVLSAPFVKPFSLARLFFSWIIPLNILTITYDGIVSVLKSRRQNQYREFFSAYSNYIDIYRIPGLLLPIVVIRIQSRK